jgi:hypothetical protein
MLTARMKRDEQRIHPEPHYAPHRVYPRCGKRHRSWYTVASCRWKRNLWIAGNPPAHQDAYATVSFCGRIYPPGVWLTFVLHATREKAELAIRLIDRVSCGGACSKQHRLTHLPIKEV